MKTQFPGLELRGYRPPAPVPKQMLSLFDGELLSMLPQASYEQDFISWRKGKRPIVIINNPAAIKAVLVENASQFPKSDVMIEALHCAHATVLYLDVPIPKIRSRTSIDAT